MHISSLSWTALRHALESWLIFFPPANRKCFTLSFSFHPSIDAQTLKQCVLKSQPMWKEWEQQQQQKHVWWDIVFSSRFLFFSAAPVPVLWQQWRFSPEAMFYVLALMLRGPSVCVVSVQEGFVVRNSSETPRSRKCLETKTSREIF